MKFFRSHLTLWNACLGNLFEHYDSALFALLSPFIAPLFFPKQDALSALILTYAMIPIGMLARPFGSLIFGYIGDAYGRKRALLLTLMGSGLISGLMAFCPTYEQTGVLAPILLCAGKAAQNFLSAGESMGGAIFLLENAPESKRDFLSSLYNASTIGGILLASLGVSCLCAFKAIDSWRVLYLIGCITALFGLILRFKFPKEEVVAKLKTLNPWKVYWQHRSLLLFVAMTAGFSYATYVVAIVLTNGLVPLVTTLTKAEMANLNTVLLIVDFLSLPLFGLLAARISNTRLMIGSALVCALTALPLFQLLEGANLPMIILLRLSFVLIGVAFSAAFHSWLLQVVPSAHRYTINSFGYALGSQLFGGPTASIALWCFQKTHLISSAAWYWALLALGAAVAVKLCPSRSLVKEQIR